MAMTLMQIFADFVVPRIIHSYNKPTLVSEIITQFYAYMGTTHQPRTQYNSHQLGKAEQSIGSAI